MQVNSLKNAIVLSGSRRLKISIMRKFIICAMLLFFAIASFGQQPKPSEPVSQETYLRRSKHQKTAAVILFSAGLLSTALGSIQTNPNSIGENSSRSHFFTIAGLAAIGASIPLFVSYVKNKRKAKNVSTYLRFEQVPLLQEGGLTLYPHACLVLKLNL